MTCRSTTGSVGCWTFYMFFWIALNEEGSLFTKAKLKGHTQKFSEPYKRMKDIYNVALKTRLMCSIFVLNYLPITAI